MNNNESLVSVIIPVYNTEKYLKKCIESVINQTYRNLEIICIDDGSTDRSLNILKQFESKDNRIRIIQQENKGVSAARNIGIDNTNGKYLMFVDSDDWIESNMVAELFSLAEREDTDVIISGILYENIKEKTKFYKIPKSPNWLSHENILALIPNKFHKSKLIKKYNIIFNTEIKMSEDFLFNMEVLAKSHKVCIMPKIFYHYILHGNNTALNLKNRVESFIVLDKIYDVLEEENILRDSSQKEEMDTLAVCYLKDVFSRLLYANDNDEFIHYFKMFMTHMKKIDYLGLNAKIKIYLRAFIVYFIYIFHLKKLVIFRRKIKGNIKKEEDK